MSISDYILGHEDYEDVIRWKKAAGCFRRGDAVAISSLFMRTFCPDQEEGRDCSMCGLEARDVCDMMSRIQEAAEILEANETPRSWQITEERKAALSAMSSLRTDVDCPQCDAWLHFSDIAEHAPVLRAMLTEAA